MASFNKVILVGNLTRKPDMRYTPSGSPVCVLGIAINDRRKSGDGNYVEETTFVDVTFWGKNAETCNEYLTKGSPILVEGRLKLEQWVQDDRNMQKLRVVGERFQMLGSGNRNNPQAQTYNRPYNPTTSPDDFSGSIPF
ncbi:MAG: single-stranded DNA-binding protein [Clostridia bacterium]|nr:single-stranded DNA-binding protein [Clostridia bacterium]